MVCGFSSFFLTSAGPSHGRFHRRSQARRVDQPEVSMSTAPDLPAPLRTPSQSNAPHQRHQASAASEVRLAVSALAPDPALLRRIALECQPPCSLASRTHPPPVGPSNSDHRRRPSAALALVRSSARCTTLRHQPVQSLPLLARKPHNVLLPHFTPSHRLWSRHSGRLATGGFKGDGTLAIAKLG